MTKNAAKEVVSERFVSATELAQRIDVCRTYINKLESEGVLRRTPRGFPLDASVINYIRHLRRERPQSPRGAADAELATANARWLNLRVKEKEGTRMPTSVHEEILETAAGCVLQELHSLPAQLFAIDIVGRRRAEVVIIELRKRVAEKCLRLAEQHERRDCCR
jgi:hypothetical protein